MTRVRRPRGGGRIASGESEGGTLHHMCTWGSAVARRVSRPIRPYGAVLMAVCTFMRMHTAYVYAHRHVRQGSRGATSREDFPRAPEGGR